MWHYNCYCTLKGQLLRLAPTVNEFVIILLKVAVNLNVIRSNYLHRTLFCSVQ